MADSTGVREIDFDRIYKRKDRDYFLSVCHRLRTEIRTECRQLNYEETKLMFFYRSLELGEKQFVEDSYSLPVFNLLLLYFAKDDRFISAARELNVDNPSLDKGILLGGNVGRGKTYLMRLFDYNSRRSYKLANAKQVATAYEKDGVEGIECYQELGEVKYGRTFPTKAYCIDDIGTEDLKIFMGNRRNVIGDIIESRYDLQLMGDQFHATTNLSPVKLEDYYGQRVVSRLTEMTNLIEVKGSDRRAIP